MLGLLSSVLAEEIDEAYGDEAGVSELDVDEALELEIDEALDLEEAPEEEVDLFNLESNVDVSVETEAQLTTALTEAPINANVPFVINVEADINLTGDPSVTNGRLVQEGRNIVIQSENGASLLSGNTATAAGPRHFMVAGNGTLTIGSGIILTRNLINLHPGGGVIIDDTGTFILSGGNIEGNRVSGSGSAILQGGGVVVNTGGLFEMFGGRIYKNVAVNTDNGAGTVQGGGVWIQGSTSATGKAQFNMYGGEIIDNFTSGDSYTTTEGSPNYDANGGGGVFNAGIFHLYGGTIAGNTGSSIGGGVYTVGQGTAAVDTAAGIASASTFNMYGGLIYDNESAFRNETGVLQGGRGGGAVSIGHNTTFNMYGGSIDSNTASFASGDGGGIESFGRMNMYGGTITRNNGRQGGGINNHQNGILIFHRPEDAPVGIARDTALASDFYIAYNRARGAGGGIVMRGGTVTMHAGEIRANNALGATLEGKEVATAYNGGSGGGIFVAAGTLTMHGGEIHGNTAHNNDATGTSVHVNHRGGGGVYVLPGATFIMNDGAITENDTGSTNPAGANSGGGGVHVRGTFYMHGGEISENVSEASSGTSGGGGVYVSPGSIFSMTNNSGPIVMNDNETLNHGGAIAMYDGGIIVFNEGEISGNTAMEDGGAIAVIAGATAMNLNIHGGIIHDNTAGGNGGAIAITRVVDLEAAATVAAVPVFNMTGGEIRDNTANHFLGVHFAPVVNNTISGTIASNLTNTFTISGDAVVDEVNYVPSITHTKDGTAGNISQTLTFNLEGNAKVDAINIAPSLNIPGAATTAGRANTFNFTMADHAAIEHGLVFGGSLTSSAGGTAVVNNSIRTNTLNFTMNNGIINGGIDFTPHLSTIGGNSAGTITNSIRANTLNFIMNDGIIMGGNRTNGGGIRFEPSFTAAAGFMRTNNSTFRINDGMIRDGIAQVSGGGVYHRPDSNITGSGTHHVIMEMNGGSVDNNRAGVDGGGLYMTLSTTGGTTPTPTFNMTLDPANPRSVINNEAEVNGGGIFIAENVIFNGITNAEIDDNTAKTGSGGGIFVETPAGMINATGTFTMDNSSLNDNISYGNGASIWIDRCANFVMNNSSLTSNETQNGDGGGLHFSPVGTIGVRTVTLNGDNTINENDAPSGDGGGLWIENANLNISGSSTVSYNTASGSGGGVRLQYTPELAATMPDTGIVTLNDNSSLRHNTSGSGGGLWVENASVLTTSEKVDISYNEAKLGGGLVANNSTVVLNGGSIEKNIAHDGDGGGAYLINQTDFSMMAGVIRGNRATNGGGVYVDEAAYFVGNGGAITRNHATESGGGLFSERYEYKELIAPDAYDNLILSPEMTLAENTAKFPAFGPANPEVINDHIPITLVGSVPDIHILNNYDIDYPIRNFASFSFFKMDELLYSDFEHATFLEGAIFEISHYEEGDWVLVDTQESDQDGYVEFMPLTLNGTYRLAEVNGLFGHEISRGHWLIEIDSEGEATVTAENDLTPVFRIDEGIYFVGNTTGFRLPILGGIDINQKLILTGLWIMLAVSCMLLLVRRRRRIYG